MQNYGCWTLMQCEIPSSDYGVHLTRLPGFKGSSGKCEVKVISQDRVSSCTVKLGHIMVVAMSEQTLPLDYVNFSYPRAHVKVREASHIVFKISSF